MAEWSTADYALIISLCSFALASAGFVWNVWSKFIFPKPKVNVGMSVMQSYQPNAEWGPRTVGIHATNFGPIDVTLKLAVARKRKTPFQRKPSLGLLKPYNDYPADLENNGPFSGGLPKKLTVGEEFSVYLPTVKSWFEKDKMVRFGFQDTFGRFHWCRSSDVTRTRKAVLTGGAEK